MGERVEETPFPVPPRDGALARFPEAIPWTTPIYQMSNWWLEITCSCSGNPMMMPLRLLAARVGWRRTLRDIVPHLKCRHCGRRAANVALTDGSGGDIGRFGARTSRLHLYP